VQLSLSVVIVLGVAGVLVGISSLFGSVRRYGMVTLITPLVLRWLGWAIGLRITIRGTRSPNVFVFVGNHVSYLDILVAGVGTAAVFVSRHDVRHWPVIGLLARMAGTVFLDRESLRSAVAGSEGIVRRSKQRIRMVLFPEGRTTSGETLGEFRPFLFKGLAQHRLAVQPFVIDYRSIGGVPIGPDTRQLVYWYDPAPSFAQHGWRLICLSYVEAELTFLAPIDPPDVQHNDQVRIWSQTIRQAIETARRP